MPRGEDVEIAEPAAFLPLLVALFLVAPRALTFLLFFTKLPSSFENLSCCESPAKYKLSTFYAYLDCFMMAAVYGASLTTDWPFQSDAQSSSLDFRRIRHFTLRAGQM